jgi:MFS transporter, DHA1 family, multidrug resistance protein
MRYKEFISLMALTMSMVAMSTDAILPGLPYIGDEMGIIEDNRRQLVIGALFLGLALSQVIYGPLADSLGRKPIIYVGISLFSLGCLVSIMAPSFDAMLIGRFIQGVGVAAPRVIAVAIIRDRYEGRIMAKTVSVIMTIFILVPVFAPLVGQAILVFADWRGIFGFFLFMAASTVIWMTLRLPETLTAENRHPLSFRHVGRAFGEISRNRMTMGYMMATACLFSSFVGYLTSAQQIFQDIYGLAELFPVAFALLAGSIGVASFVNSRLVVRLGMRLLVRTALIAMIGLSATLLAVTFVFGGVPPLWILFALMVPLFFCNGTLFGNLNALAMQPMGHIAGSAAAALGAGTTVLSASLGTLIGQVFDGTIFPLAVGFSLFAVLAYMFCRWADREKEDSVVA